MRPRCAGILLSKAAGEGDTAGMTRLLEQDGRSATPRAPVSNPRDLCPIGYSWLAREFKLNPMPHHVEWFRANPGERRTVETGGGRS